MAACVGIHKLTIKSEKCMKTGNVKQVAAFGKLVGICSDLGASYNPSKELIMPTALGSLLEQAQQNEEAVKVALMNYRLAVNSRQESFAGIPKLAARIVRSVSASEGPGENLEDAKILKRKFKPKVKPKKAIGSIPAEEGAPKEARPLSKLDYDGKMETLGNLIQLVQSIPAYSPNETDLKVASLKTFLADLHARSAGVNTAASAHAKARIARNQTMYGEDGVFETATAVKDYIRSVFGSRSEQASQVGKLRFRS